MNRKHILLLLLILISCNLHAQEGLPPGWHTTDIGSLSVPGSSEYDSDADIFTLEGTGDQIFRPDNLHFAYTIQTGNFEIITLVSFITGMGTDGYDVSPFEEAGVMVREDLGPFSKTYYLSVKGGDGGIRYYVRNDEDLDKSNHPGEGARDIAVPAWLKIKRIGNSFDSYYSLDGVNWTYSPDATMNIPMNSTCYVGLWCRGNANFVEIWGWGDPNPGSIYNMVAEFEATDIVEIANIYTVQNPVKAHFVNINDEDNLLGVSNVFGKLETDEILYSATSSDLKTCRVTTTEDSLAFNPRALGSCTMTLTAEVASFDLVNKFPVFVWETPEGWQSKDLGNVKASGYVLKQNSMLTLGGSAGASTIQQEEGSHYLYKNLNGDIELSGKIVSTDFATKGSLCGLAILDSASENNSKMARIVYAGDGMIRFESRENQGDTVLMEAQVNASLPVWVKISLDNNAVSAYVSEDNSTWTPLGSEINLNLNNDYTAGLLSGSNDNPGLNTCIFDNIQILNNVPELNNPVADQHLLVGENAEINISKVFGYSGEMPEIELENGSPSVIDAEITNDTILNITALSTGESFVKLTTTIDTVDLENAFTVIATSPLPDDWIFEDVGPVVNQGFAVNNGNNAFSVSTFGNHIAGNQDNFSYLYKSKERARRITANITAIEDRGSGSQAGVMFRESTESGSLNILYTCTAYEGIKLQYRWDDNSYTVIEGSDPDIEPPIWLRLERDQYNYFQAYYSEDRESWTPHGEFKVPLELPSETMIGLAATSGLALGTSTFEDVTIKTFGFPTGLNEQELNESVRVTSYPNPFRDQATIDINLDKPMDVLVNVYNVTGVKISELCNERMYPGSHKISFDASGLESGVYYFRVVTPEKTISERMLLLR